MIYKVIVQATAIADAVDYASFIIEQNNDTVAAEKWLNELESAIETLAEMPRRFRIIDEQSKFPIELRQLLHYSHRVIFHVNDDTVEVHVLRVYHMKRDELKHIPTSSN